MCGVHVHGKVAIAKALQLMQTPVLCQGITAPNQLLSVHVYKLSLLILFAYFIKPRTGGRRLMLSMSWCTACIPHSRRRHRCSRQQSRWC